MYHDLINLTMHPEVRAKNVKLCREKGIVLPTFAQMVNPSKTPATIQKKLKQTGLWDVDSANLFRINWRNEPVENNGLFGEVNFIEVPRQITGTKAGVGVGWKILPHRCP